MAGCYRTKNNCNWRGSSEKINYLSGYNTITQNSAGDIIFDCGTCVVDIYVSNEKYTVNYLKNKYLADKYNGTYIGTLEI